MKVIWVLISALALVLLTSSASSASVAASSTPAYGKAGPHTVGVTTIDLGISAPKFGERFATVYYPSSLSSSDVADLAKFSYTQADTLPSGFQSFLPAQYNLPTTVDAYPNIPGSTAGPYPIVLFDFGASGQRLLYSNLLSGIASWGYVVVAADYFEHSLAAQVMGVRAQPSAALDLSVMLSSLDAIERASADPASVLHGTAKSSRVAAIGHSAGGETAFNALNSPRVATAIGWSPVGPVGRRSKKPIMIIRPTGDHVITAARVNREYANFPGPKALVEPSGEGHNTYTDTCVVIRNGGGLIQYAIAHHLVAAKLAQLGFNGCLASDLAPARFWPVVQYYTVFQLRARLGNGPTTVPAPPAGMFPGFNISITQSG